MRVCVCLCITLDFYLKVKCVIIYIKTLFHILTQYSNTIISKPPVDLFPQSLNAVNIQKMVLLFL